MPMFKFLVAKFTSNSGFPANLSENPQDANSLETMWWNSVLRPFMFLIGDPTNTIFLDNYMNNVTMVAMLF